jgi:hypothetical protein
MPPSLRHPGPGAGRTDTILTLPAPILATCLHVADAVVRESLGGPRRESVPGCMEM